MHRTSGCDRYEALETAMSLLRDRVPEPPQHIEVPSLEEAGD
jgi:hypothetical protein